MPNQELTTLLNILQHQGTSPELLQAIVKTAGETVLRSKDQPGKVSLFNSGKSFQIIVNDQVLEKHPLCEDLTTAIRLALVDVLDSVPATNQTPQVTPTPVTTTQKTSSRLSPQAQGFLSLIPLLIFWGINIYAGIIGVLVATFFILNGSLKHTISTGNWQDVITLFAGVAIPLTAMHFGKQLHQQKQNHKIWSLLFFFELPLLFITFILIPLSKEIPPILMLMFGSFCAIPALLFANSLWNKQPRLQLLVRVALSTYIVTLILYCTVLYLFFLPPWMGRTIQEYWPNNLTRYSVTQGSIGWEEDVDYRLHDRVQMPQPIPPSPGELIVAYTAALLIITLRLGILLLIPMAALYVVYRWNRIIGKAVAEVGRNSTLSWTVGGIVVCLAALLLVSSQPTNKWFDELEKYDQATTFEEKQAIAATLQSNMNQVGQSIRWLKQARHNYPWQSNETIVGSDYENDLNFPRETASAVESLFKMVAFPFILHSGDLEYYNLQQIYYDVYGQTAAAKEAETGVKPTPTPTQSWQPVKLLRRDISATTLEGGRAAYIEVDEEYQNTNSQNEEAWHELYLPPPAVVTSLLLGPNLEFPGQIAPRGAATQVFNQQIQRKRDPALLEETGPSTYRLRVYPVPAQNDMTTLKGRPQRVRYGYVTPLTAHGFPLPQVINSNLNPTATAKTLVTIDSKPITLSQDQVYLAAPDKATLCQLLQSQGLTTKNQSNLQPNVATCDNKNELSYSTIPWPARTAILVDVSTADSSTITDDVETQWDEIRQLVPSALTQEDKPVIDLYFYNQNISQPTRVSLDSLKALPENLTFFGTSQLSQTISSIPSNYDQVIVIAQPDDTDSNKRYVNPRPLPPVPMGMKLEDSISPTLQLNTVNEPMQPPIKQNDQTIITLIPAGGKVTVPPRETFLNLLENNLWVTASLPDALSLGNAVLNNTQPVPLTALWKLPGDLTALSTELTTTNSASNIAKAWIAYSSIWSQLTNMTDLYQFETNPNSVSNQDQHRQQLDQINAVSKNAGVVSPYSTYIALINETQQQQLDDASQDADRYSTGRDDIVFNNNRNIMLEQMQPASGFETGAANMLPSLFGVKTQSNDSLFSTSDGMMPLSELSAPGSATSRPVLSYGGGAVTSGLFLLGGGLVIIVLGTVIVGGIVYTVKRRKVS